MNRRIIVFLFCIAVVSIIGLLLILNDPTPPEKLEPDSISKEPLETAAPNPPGPEPSITKEVIKSQSPSLSVTVKEKATGKPVVEFCARLYQYKEEQRQWETLVQENVRNNNGLFTCALTIEGRLFLDVGTSQHIHFKEEIFEDYKKSLGSQILEIQLDPGEEVFGRVVEDSSGKAVPGVLVVERNQSNVGMDLFSKHPHSGIHAWTDENGAFNLKGLKTDYYGSPLNCFQIIALHPDFTEGHGECQIKGSKEVQIRLIRGHRVFGKVLGDQTMLPLEGVRISVKSEKTSFSRSVLTNQDGEYRSAPTHVGPISVTASSHDDTPFIEITKVAEIVNKDVEVNFGGVSDLFITWKGKVLDQEAQPMKSASIQLEHKATLIETDLRMRHHIRAKSDKQGSFELTKLLPGRYVVKVWNPIIQEYMVWDEMVLETPGLFEKDISFVGKGARVYGVVVVKPGADFPEDTVYSVFAMNYKSHKQYKTPLNLEESSFCFPYLPAGTYSFFYRDCDPVFNIRLADGQVMENLRLVSNPKGELLVLLKGFKESDLKHLKITLGPLLGRDRTFDVKEHDRTWALNEGAYYFYLSKKNKGAIKRTFKITPNSTTDIVIHVHELDSLSPMLVKGSLKTSFGEPVSNVNLYFSTQFHIYPTRPEKSCQTDEDGCFIIKEMPPGRWSARCKIDLPEQGKKGALVTYIHDLHVPPNPDLDYMLDLVLCSGAIKGRIVDGETGALINMTDIPWRLWLGDVNNRWMGELFGELSLFTLNHVSPGEYVVGLTAPGYQPFRSKPFLLTKGQVIDLGDIPLHGSGILELEVVNVQGEPIWFHAYCNKAPMGGHSGNEMSISRGKKIFSMLPVGDMEIEVKSNGHQPEKYIVKLIPAEKVTLKAVLSPLK